MARIIYLTHPQVVIDPDVPVPDWGLNAEGHARVAGFVARDAARGVTRIVASGERKAVDTATPIAAALGLPLEVRERMHENDRSATGFLPGEAFEATADAFFAEPDRSVRGWETALNAQARVLSEAEDVLSTTNGDVLFVGHGAVGTLLFCHFAGREIDRRHDQIGGGGNIWVFDRTEGRMLHGWRPMEDWSL